MLEAPVVLRSWERNLCLAIYYFLGAFFALGVVGALVPGGEGGLAVGSWLGVTLGVLLGARSAATRVVIHPDGTLDIRNPLRSTRIQGSEVTEATLTRVGGRLTAVRLATTKQGITLAALDGPLVARLRQIAPWASAIEWPEWPRTRSFRMLFGRGRVS